MKKIIRIFLNYILVSATIVNVVTCKWGCTNNDYHLADENEQDISGDFIVPDLNKRTNKIRSDRLNMFGEDITNIKDWYVKNSQKWFTKTSSKLKFVSNIEIKMQYQAKKEAIDEFNLLANNNDNFINFNDLQNQLNNTYLGKVYVKVDWNQLINSLTVKDNEKDEIRNKLIRFYNIFAQIYGKKMCLNSYIKWQKLIKEIYLVLLEADMLLNHNLIIH